MLGCFNWELSQKKLLFSDHLDIVHKKEQEKKGSIDSILSRGQMHIIMTSKTKFIKVFLKPPGIFSEFCRVPSPKRAAYLSLCGTVWPT